MYRPKTGHTNDRNQCCDCKTYWYCMIRWHLWQVFLVPHCQCTSGIGIPTHLYIYTVCIHTCKKYIQISIYVCLNMQNSFHTCLQCIIYIDVCFCRHCICTDKHLRLLSGLLQYSHISSPELALLSSPAFASWSCFSASKWFWSEWMCLAAGAKKTSRVIITLPCHVSKSCMVLFGS